MSILRPFFSYYGAKFRMARKIGAPQRDMIIEPFAGSACYSCYWGATKDVILIDVNPIVTGLWRYLIKVQEKEIMHLPVNIDCVDNLKVPQEAKWLIGFWFNKGAVSPATKRSNWARRSMSDHTVCLTWSSTVRTRIAAQLKHIRHWQVCEGSYHDAPDIEAHWHIDPPYQQAGYYYKYNDIDYEELGSWCKARKGFVQVFENSDADWLPFKSFSHTIGSHNKRNPSKLISKEAIFQLGRPLLSLFNHHNSTQCREERVTMTTAIEKELVKATGVKMSKFGDRQEALTVLVKAVNDLPDEDWRRISPESQNWYNSASEAVDNGTEIDDFVDDSEPESSDEETPEEDSAPDYEAAEAEEAAEEAPRQTKGKKQKEPTMKKTAAAAKKANGKHEPPKAKTVAKKAAASAAPAKKAAKPAAKTPPAARSSRSEGGEGGPILIRRWVIKNTKVTASELTDMLVKKGRKISPATVSAVRAATISTLKLLDEAGHLKNLKL